MKKVEQELEPETSSKLIDRRKAIAVGAGAAVSLSAFGCRTTERSGLAAGAKDASLNPSDMYEYKGPVSSKTKQQAEANYIASFPESGGRLSTSISAYLRNRHQGSMDFDVIVVGSGYGASICAARLAGQARAAGKALRICMLERGKEWIPGSTKYGFPDTFPAVKKELRNSLFGDNPLGLLDYRANKEMDVLCGNGVGGTSLINSNVAIRPDANLFEFVSDSTHKRVWPRDLNLDKLSEYYKRAQDVLDPTTSHTATKKLGTHLDTGKLLQGEFQTESYAANITVNTKYRRRNDQDVIQAACTDCGDCVTGCNVGAKNTLPMNYLAMAKRSGVEIYSHAEVSYIEKLAAKSYRVHLKNNADGGHHATLKAKLVIVGAGTYGSSEILLRTRDRATKANSGFVFSPRLGRGFSGNGDYIGFVKNIGRETDIAGTGAVDDAKKRVGPNIQGVVDYRRDKKLLELGLKKTFVMEEWSSARAYNLPLSLLVFGIGNGNIDNRMILVCIGHDRGDGSFRYVDGKDRAVIDWPEIVDPKEWEHMDIRLREHANKLGGVYVPNFRYWSRLLGNNITTVHPLGGCGMGDDASLGTVNHKGQVFNPAGGVGAVHEGFYICDGSVIPMSLGVNPFLTISAVAERTAEAIVRDHADIFG